MRQDYLIAIMLALAALPAGAALMVAPEYLHLTGIAVPLTFWGGIILAVLLIFVAVVVALRGEKKAIQETKMDASEVGYNIALIAAIASIAGAIRRSPRTAIIACAVAWIGIGIDYWLGPPRGFIWEQRPRQMFADSPLGWSDLSISASLFKDTNPTNVTGLIIIGTNLGDTEIKLDDAYFISGIDGSRLDAKISDAGKEYRVSEVNPVPPGAIFFILSDRIGGEISGATQEEFLKTWSRLSFVAKYADKTYRANFDAAKIKSLIPKRDNPMPHVSPANKSLN